MPITITFSIAGSFTIEDNGIPGDNTSIVRRDSDGAILAIIPHPADALNFRAIVPGVNLTINITDSLGAADLTVGSLTNTAETPDSITVRNINTSGAVTLVSNGAIVEGGADLAADIVAGSLILSAAAGVGTPGNAIETQTGLMEVETTSGGINISNVGDLQVGGLSANVDGLDVITAGDILITNLGSITLADETSFDSVHGGNTSGNVTLIANGYDSDITSIVDQSSIIANRGSIFLTAGRDVSFGLGGVEFGNDVRADGSIVVNAGRDFLLSGFADFFADGVTGTTGGNLIVNAGRNISLLDDTGNSASLAVLGSGGGDVILTTGPGGRFTLEPPSVNALSSGSGSVIVNADRIVIFASTGITAAGEVILRPVSEGRAIILGSLSDGADALELSDGELDRIFAGTLILGSDTTGPITVGAPISPGSVTSFTLRSGTDIFVNASLTAPNILSLLAGDSVFQLAASTLTATTVFVSGDVGNTDPGFGASVIMNGAIVGANMLSGSTDADTIIGSSDANTIDGGAGDDSMSGGLGDDTFLVDSAGDMVIEAVGAGTDIVYSSVSYVLRAGAEVEILSTSSQAGSAPLALIGNEFAQEIYGNAGANFLEGGGGADILIGFGGDDTYVVEGSEDVIGEASGDGTDIVYSRASYTLTAGAEVEILSTISQAETTAISLIGNGFAQTIYGNAGGNFIAGGGGADALVGLAGDDVYLVDSADDYVGESAGGGRDVVYTGVSYALAAGQEVEILSTSSQAGTDAIDLVGNELANELYGNEGANVLDGGGGADVLQGFGGDDTFAFTTALGGGNVDAILGFTTGADTIALDDAVFTQLGGPGALAAGAFVTGSAAADADDRIVYDSATGQLYYDADGNGAGAAMLFATLSPGLNLAAGDFAVI